MIHIHMSLHPHGVSIYLYLDWGARVGTAQCEDGTVKCERKVKEPLNVTKELLHMMLELLNVMMKSLYMRKKLGNHGLWQKELSRVMSELHNVRIELSNARKK